MFKQALLTLTLIVFSFHAGARGDVAGIGLGGAIPDNNASGRLSTINISQNQLITGNVQIYISGLTHTYAGDLIATLTGPDGTVVTLFNRIGRVNTGFGDSSNFNGNYTILDTPINANGSNIWTEAALGNSTYNLRAGQYRATNANSSLSTLITPSFLGKSTMGNWQLRISDRAAADTGNFASWAISMSSVSPVPEPASLLHLTLVGLAVFCRYRRR
jgi:subtilisin-like proprotein convertase family protein